MGMIFTPPPVIVPVASTTVDGKVELATTAETATGTDTGRAVTPDGLHDMATLSGAAWMLDEDDLNSDSDTKVASQQSLKAYIDAGGGLANIVEDTTPQLGGDLDAQNNSILNVGAADNDWTTNEFKVSSTNAGGSNFIRVNNNDNSDTASHARMVLSVGGTSSGDAYIQFDESTNPWGIGFDVANARFALGYSALGGNDALRITGATPPVISYNATHPTGTFDYVCGTCGKHSHEVFDCCGKVEWHDDVLAMRAVAIDLATMENPYLPGVSVGVERLVRLGVMEYDSDTDPKELAERKAPWLGINLKAAQWFTWAGMYQNRQRMESYRTEQALEIKELRAEVATLTREKKHGKGHKKGK